MRIISGAFRGRALKSVDGPGYRPATGRVREALFSMLKARNVLMPELAVLDLYAGTGSLAFEAASRGAGTIVLVELAENAVRCLAQNAAALGLHPPRCRILREDVARLLARPVSRKGDPLAGERFGLVFLDPPYGKDLVAPTLRLLIAGGRIAPRGVVVAEIEQSALFDAHAFPGLETVIDRAYGQTRIIVWEFAGGTETSPLPADTTR